MKKRRLKTFLKRGLYAKRVTNEFLLYWHRADNEYLYKTLGNIINRTMSETEYISWSDMSEEEKAEFFKSNPFKIKKHE